MRTNQLAEMSGDGFEQACADLLTRDGFATGQTGPMGRRSTVPGLARSGPGRPGSPFPARAGEGVVGRLELKRWAHGEHLYAVVQEEHSPA